MKTVNDLARISERFRKDFYNGEGLATAHMGGGTAGMNAVRMEMDNGNGRLEETLVYVVAYGDAMGLEWFEPFQTADDATRRFSQVLHMLNREDQMWLPEEQYEVLPQVSGEWLRRVIHTVEARRMVRVAEVILDSNGTPTEWVEWKDYEVRGDINLGSFEPPYGWEEVDYS